MAARCSCNRLFLRVAVCAIAMLLMMTASGCDGRPQEQGPTTTVRSAPASRTSRLQKPSSPALQNTGFDEIVVESNLQVHNRVGSKNKSKIMLPSNSTTTPANKSGRSLVQA